MTQTSDEMNACDERINVMEYELISRMNNSP